MNSMQKYIVRVTTAEINVGTAVYFHNGFTIRVPESVYDTIRRTTSVSADSCFWIVNSFSIRKRACRLS